MTYQNGQISKMTTKDAKYKNLVHNLQLSIQYIKNNLQQLKEIAMFKI